MAVTKTSPPPQAAHSSSSLSLPLQSFSSLLLTEFKLIPRCSVLHVHTEQMIPFCLKELEAILMFALSLARLCRDLLKKWPLGSEIVLRWSWRLDLCITGSSENKYYLHKQISTFLLRTHSMMPPPTPTDQLPVFSICILSYPPLAFQSKYSICNTKLNMVRFSDPEANWHRMASFHTAELSYPR